MLRSLKFTAPLAFAVTTIGANAAGEGSTGLQVRVTVPEVCEVQLSGPLVTMGTATASAQVIEMCNSQRQFRVIAAHRALEEDEQVRVNYGGEVNELHSSGVSNLALVHGPALRTVPISVHSIGLASALVISIGMAAI